MQGKLDLLLIFETKINDNVLEAQLSIEGFSDHSGIDRTVEGRGVCLYLRQD